MEIEKMSKYARKKALQAQQAAKESSGGGKGDLASLPDPDMMW